MPIDWTDLFRLYCLWTGREFEKAPPIKGSFKDVQIKSRSIEDSLWGLATCPVPICQRVTGSEKTNILLAFGLSHRRWSKRQEQPNQKNSMNNCLKQNSFQIFDFKQWHLMISGIFRHFLAIKQELSEVVVQWLGGPGAWQLATVANWPLTPEALRRPTTARRPACYFLM